MKTSMHLYLALVLLCLPQISRAEVSFNREILPILSDKCYHCHGQDASHRKADLRLDTFEHATAIKDGMAAIVPGEPNKSLLIELIQTDDQDDIMPPVKTGKTLTQKEKSLLVQWVSEGAKYEKHWAYIQPKKATLPKVKQVSWPEKAIDHYVLANLEKRNWSPSEQAESYTLMRRLHFDLTGLPPKSENIKAYLDTPSLPEYEKVVDELLNSDAYAERMAMVWMSAARYSDTDGFQADSTRSNWPWKNWVIKAYKNNMPFDRFTIEQLAGDLLPNPSHEQILATSFNRHHMTNGEGGRDPEESRIDYVMDRVNTMGTTWLGLTVGCAQCHDHKFDPISQKEYYQLNAFFNSIDEDGSAGKKAKPYLKYTPTMSGNVLERIEQWLSYLVQKERELNHEVMKDYQSWLDQKFADITSQSNFSSWHSLQADKLKTAGGSALQQPNRGQFKVSGANPNHEDYILTYQKPLSPLTGLKINLNPYPKDGKLVFSESPGGNLIFTNLKIYVRSTTTGLQKSVNLERAKAKATYAKKQKEQKAYGNPQGILDDDPRTGWTSEGAELKPQAIMVKFAQPVEVKENEELIVELRHRSLNGHESMRDFSLEWTQEFGRTAEKFATTPSEAIHQHKGDLKKLSSTAKRDLEHEFRSTFVRVRNLRKELQEARNTRLNYKKYMEPQDVMVMAERKKPRPSHILLRGEWDKKGETVSPNVPIRIAPMPNEKSSDMTRLDLAKWIVSPQNPLTARVAVNRYWQMLFGKGLVRTPEDFGLQGSYPTQPEVLDWLAVEFMEKKWDVKHILKTIVMSKTYRQSSQIKPAIYTEDPENHLLAYAPRFRLPSWMIRDSILKASGMLTDGLGGPPVYPFQPVGAWKDATMGRFIYKASPGKDAYRRSLYTFWRRSVGPTNMFDSSKRRNCSIRRVITNTPLQALNLLNDTAYLEAARSLAVQAIRHSDSHEARLRFIAHNVINRDLSPEELNILLVQYNRTQAYYQQHHNEAHKLCRVGRANSDLEQFQQDQLASYITLAQTFLNLDETITRE